jgi:large subunit ribosomal protein L10Ae
MLNEAIEWIQANKNTKRTGKKVGFKQTVEFQVGLKDYDPKKDKRFAGSVRLPNMPRENLKICLIADAKHQEEAKKAGLNIDVTDLDTLKKFNKDKKMVKRWAKQYSVLLATDSLIKKIPVVLGPTLNRIGMFPQVVSHDVPLRNKIDDVRSSIKFQLKKVTCLNVAVGHEEMTIEELRQNITMTQNFLVSLLKKGWHNVKSINIKTTQGRAYKIL